MLPIERKEMQPQTWSALIPLALSAVIIFAASKAGVPFLYFIGGFCAVLSLLLFWFLRQSKLTIDDHGLSYQTKISTREFLWKDITSTFISEHFNGKRRVRYWNFEKQGGEKLSLPLSHYSRNNLNIIAQAVAAKCSHAQKDAKVATMLLTS